MVVLEDLEVRPYLMDDPVFFKSIVETIREPLLVVDEELRVVLANRAFFQTFRAEAAETENAYLFVLGNGQWNIPALRELLLVAIPQNESFENFPITHDFPAIGVHSMVLNARKLYRPGTRRGCSCSRLRMLRDGRDIS